MIWFILMMDLRVACSTQALLSFPFLFFPFLSFPFLSFPSIIVASNNITEEALASYQ